MPASTPSPIAAMLPYHAPEEHPARLLLYAFRRMGAHGLNDAQAANAMLGTFGQSYRCPLVLLRALMAEMARTAQAKISIAGCCCARMTQDEALLIEAISQSNADARGAHELLANALGTADCIGALVTVQALEVAFFDLGKRLG